MEEISGLKELYENFEQLSGLDVEDYEIVETDQTGDYPGEKIYEVSVKLGEEKIPETGSYRVGLNHMDNDIGESLRVSFKDVERTGPEDAGSSERNLLTVPFRQLFDLIYDLDFSDYTHEESENREFTVRDKSDGWKRNIPRALRKAGLEYEEFNDGMKIRKDGEEYALELRDGNVEVFRPEIGLEPDPVEGVREVIDRKDKISIENLEELEQLLGEIE